jgi:hypothetical protein
MDSRLSLFRASDGFPVPLDRAILGRIAVLEEPIIDRDRDFAALGMEVRDQSAALARFSSPWTSALDEIEGYQRDINDIAVLAARKTRRPCEKDSAKIATL